VIPAILSHVLTFAYRLGQYGFAAFADKSLVPPDYPLPQVPNNTDPPKALLGFALQRNEAIVGLMCFPPPAKYFGITAYVSCRIHVNDSEFGTGDGTIMTSTPMVEVNGEMAPPWPVPCHDI
jgi:hypothetical protein